MSDKETVRGSINEAAASVRNDTGADKHRIPEPHRLPHGSSGNTGEYRNDSEPRRNGVFRNSTPHPSPANRHGSGRRRYQGEDEE